MSFLPKLLIGIKVSVMWVLKLFTILIALELLVVAGQKESKIHIPRMNRLYHRWTALFFAAVFCSCGGNSNKKDVLSSATVVFRGADSLAVEGVLLADSSKLVLPLVYAYPDNETSEYESVDKSIDELHLKKTGYLVVTTPLCGYNVTATIYDAEENNFPDIIELSLIHI